MSNWAARRALRATEPGADGLRRLEAVLGTRIVGVERIGGGVATSTHALRTADDDLVMKRFAATDLTPPLEWARLHLVQAAPIPTPEPVAFDPDGQWFGVPALVMTRLPGAAMYPPDSEALGRIVAAIHTTVLPDPVPDILGRVPSWVAGDPVEPLFHAGPLVLCHTDLHPGNVLVDGGAITGIVDWSGCRLAPRGLDIGLTRCDLAIEPGGDGGPDRFLAAYEEASGVQVEDLDEWDHAAARRALTWGHEWLDSWTEVGRPMTYERLEANVLAFLAE